MRTICSVLTVLVMLSAAARGEETVELVAVSAIAPGAAPAGGVAFDRAALPSGESFKLRMAVPGSDPVRAHLTTWPTTAATCDIADAGGRQSHVIAMRVSGEAAARVVEAVIPPLQIQVRQCFHVTVERGLMEDKAPTLAGLVMADLNTKLSWVSECSGDATLFAAKLRGLLLVSLPVAIRKLDPPAPSASLRAAPRAQYVDAAVEVIMQSLALEATCRELEQAARTAQVAARAIETTGARHAAAKARIKTLGRTTATSRGKTAPLGFVRDGTTLRPLELVDVMELSKDVIADNVKIVSRRDPAIAQLLRNINAADDAGRPAAKAALRAALGPKDGPIHLLLPGTGDYVSLEDIGKKDPVYADFAASSAQHLVAVTDQLRLLRAQAPGNAFLDEWIAATRELSAAEAAYTKAIADNNTAAAGLAGLEGGAKFAAAMATTLTSAAVRGLLRDAVTYDATTTTGNPTDDKASWLTPTVGMLVGLPITAEGIAGPWLTPYAGLTLYRRRIDRVIDLDDLVGSVSCQRWGLTLGALLSTPDIRNKDVAGPWKSDLVPYLGLGLRVTQFVRLDAGAVIFTYEDRNPVVTDRDYGLAIYLGASIDADVWAALNGKIIH